MKRIATALYEIYLRTPSLRKHIYSVLVGCGVLAVTGTVLLSTRVSTLPVGWERSFGVSPVGIAAKNVRVASRGSLIAVVFEGIQKNTHKIFVSLSFDAGRSFLDPVVIAEVAPNIEHYPSIAIAGDGHMAVAWQNLLAEDSNTRIFYALSEDMGASWKEPSRIFLASEFELLPQIYYDDKNTLHIFYHGYRKNLFNLFHSANPEGKDFTSPDSLADVSNLRGAFFPAVYFSGGNIFLIWQGKSEYYGVLSDDLYFTRSKNYGRSWSSSRRITSSTANDSSPSLILLGDTLYCAYQNNDEKSWDIKMLRGFEYGDRWEEVPTVVSTTNANCYSPRVVPGRSEELVVLWHDTRDVRPAVVARKYLILERKFSPENILSRPKATARNPVAVSIGTRVIALWEEEYRVVANFSDIYVDPPAVYSPTHPRDEWARYPGALVEWTPPADESGLAGFAVIVNRDADFVPTVQNVEGRITSYRVPDLDDGVTYFHIRSIDGSGNYSKTVHYKLQVSRSPLPMPVVVSTTHPEGAAAPSRSPVFRWSTDEKERLRGFLYSLTKDGVQKPATFTNNFEASFENLGDGRYFFSVAAVDKTNTVSGTAVYEIIVNRADAIDKSVYEKIAKGMKVVPRPAEGLPRVPAVAVNFPFNTAEPFNGTSFEALIVPRNVRPESIVGYAVAVDTTRPGILERVNLKSSIVRMRDLSNGKYFIGVRARYFVLERGTRKYYWTRPTVQRFAINYREAPSPVVAYADGVLDRLSRHWMQVSVSLLGVMIGIVTLGFGSRPGFFIQLLRFRLKNLFHV
jgi:hypothetical protein